MSWEARKPSAAWCLLKTGIQTVIIWTLALGVGPYVIVHSERRMGMTPFVFPGQVWAGGIVFVLAGMLGLISGWTMAMRGEGTPLPLDPARRLVVAGPYRWVRNPMAIGGLSQGMGVGIAAGSWGVLAYVVLGAVVWNWGVRLWEERDLAGRFGDEYEEYRRNVRCWVPRATPYRVGANGGQVT